MLSLECTEKNRVILKIRPASDRHMPKSNFKVLFTGFSFCLAVSGAALVAALTIEF